jgi:LuxR family maltose regulon positive regulatory protein
LLLCHIVLAKTFQATGNAEEALRAIRQAKRISSRISSWTVITMDAREAELRSILGDIPPATRWAQESGLSVEDEPNFQDGIRYLALAQVLVAQGKQSTGKSLGKTLEFLARLLKMAETAGAIHYVIQTLVLQAMALQAQGKEKQALDPLQSAFSLAEPEGYVRTFIDQGAPMEELLRLAAARGIATEYVNKLLVESGARTYGRMAETPSHPYVSILAEPLSERELEVLRLLAVGLSNKEIAQTLVIAVGTVKNHLKNIYGKLDVHNRTQAVARAQDLGIL